MSWPYEAKLAPWPRRTFQAGLLVPRGGALRGEQPWGPSGPQGAYSIQVIYMTIWTDRLNFVNLKGPGKTGHIPTGQKIPTGIQH